MGHLSKVEIRRFKRLEHLIIDLDQTNVLIGANNAGKSSSTVTDFLPILPLEGGGDR